MKKTKIVQRENADEIPVEIIADSIVEISAGIKKMRSGRLNDKAIVHLIHKSCNVAGHTILAVMNAMEELEKEYLKPKDQK
jgi:hypothetical protein